MGIGFEGSRALARKDNLDIFFLCVSSIIFSCSRTRITRTYCVCVDGDAYTNINVLLYVINCVVYVCLYEKNFFSGVLS